MYKALQKIAERTLDNKEDISQKNKQRRIGFVDLYGEEYTRQGDGGSPVTFYISISPDLIYYERFEFKLIIQPFATTISGTGTQSATVSIDTTDVEIQEATLTKSNGYVTQEKHKHSTKGHTHTTQPHTHGIISGVTLISATANDYRISIEGIPITPYLMAQHDGNWITGEGIFPDAKLGSEDDVYDILQVACDMEAEGNSDLVEKLLKPGFKKVEISASSPFQCTLVNYLKYSHMNR